MIFFKCFLIYAYCYVFPQPPYSYRIDECAELICFSGELLLHNSSLHCRYNTTQPQCSLLGLPILINTDPCCPLWQCPCKFNCLYSFSLHNYTITEGLNY